MAASTWSFGRAAKRTCASDIITYNAANQCLWHLVSWQSRKAYMCPGAITYNDVISACGKPRQCQQALGLLTESQSVHVLYIFSPTMLPLVPVVSLSNRNRHLVSWQSPCIHVLHKLSPTNAVIIACGEPE